MAQSDPPLQEPASTAENGNNSQSLWRRLFGRDSTASDMPGSPTKEQGSQSDDDPRPGLIRRVSRKVVPGLPRAQTFKRQQSEIRNKLEPVQPTPAERRAVSVDRRFQTPQNGSQTQSHPRSSAPDFTKQSLNAIPFAPSVPSLPVSSLEEKMVASTDDLALTSDAPTFHDGLHDGLHDEDGHDYIPDAISTADCHSMTTSQYDALIHDELERTWILNLSMHFRDKSKREKFFVTYRERPTLWRRVTISVDYRDAPENSLELELAHIKFQRDKIAKIYDAIRESLVDIQFYSTVTNLKLQTTEGRLHVHVVEDVNEIIHYPSIRTIQHMRCNRVKERDIEFDSHISGFVYKVRVNDEVLIKKEIPGPDTVDEFLYEINALNRLKHSNHVIRFYGVIVDDNEEHVKGLLISHAEQGALIDIIYDKMHPLPWSTRERWARQIVSGLSEIHEAGFVQGDFTLSNIVIDDDDNAKIIDINRRGCPVGWEPPEATPLIESNQRISMYIGVKSDLYQLGMVLWALAMKEDEPEAHGRPLRIGSDIFDVPNWFRRVVDICLSEDPRGRMPALQLLSLFPDPEPGSEIGGLYDRPSISVDDGVTRQEYFVDADPTSNGYPRVRTVQPASDWSYVGWGHSYVSSPNGLNDEPFFYPTRGRSPPSPLPSNPGEYDSSKYGYRTTAWASTPGSAAPSESDAEAKNSLEEGKKSVTPRRSLLSVADARGTSAVGELQEPRLAE
ncbi:kinase-like protein, partial [Coniochaeta sp. PMI_546]